MGSKQRPVSLLRDYTLKVIYAPGSEDPDDQISEAVPLDLSASPLTVVNGVFTTGLDADMFAVQFDPAEPLRAFFDEQGHNADFFTAEGLKVGEGQLTDQPAGTYYLLARTAGNNYTSPVTGRHDTAGIPAFEGPYRLNVVRYATDDPDDQPAEATSVALSSDPFVLEGTLSRPGDLDLYKFHGSFGQRMRITIATSPGLTPAVRIFEDEGDGAYHGTYADFGSTEVNLWSTGDYYLAISAGDNATYTLPPTEIPRGRMTGAYTLTVRLTDDGYPTT